MRYLAFVFALAACHPTLAIEQAPLGLDCSRREGIADHVPQWLQAHRPGARIDPNARLELRVVLQLRALDELNLTLREMTTPGRSAYGRAMSRADFAARHLPTEAQAKAAVEALRQAGLETDDRPVGALLGARGSSRAIEAAFATPLVATGDGGGYRPGGDPTMPSDAIRAVDGLGAHLPPRQWTGLDPGPSAPPLTPAAIRQAYGVPAGLAGQGQVLAIVGLDGYLEADLDAFAKAHAIRRVPVRPHLLGGFDGKPRSRGGQTETTMDLQLLSAVAPEAEAIWAVLAAQDNPHGLLDGLNAIANPPPEMPHIRHVSVSWGVPETGISQASIQVMGSVLKQLAATGTTVYVASGDEGAFDAGGSVRVTDSPASSPYALAVGGTSLKMGPPRTETTWAGSGGGYSCFWPAPRWQGRAWGRTLTETMRALPDVALAADPNTPYAALVNGQAVAVGGTSAAAPVMAAMGALLAQSRAEAGKTTLGFLPPLLYSASCDAPAPGFNDIVVGNTSGAQAPGSGIDAALGYDAAAGLGSVNLEGLLRQLECLP